MKIDDIVADATYEGKDGKRRVVDRVFAGRDLIDWRRVGEADGPRGSLKSFARWAARRVE